MPGGLAGLNKVHYAGLEVSSASLDWSHDDKALVAGCDAEKGRSVLAVFPYPEFLPSSPINGMPNDPCGR